MLIVSNLTAAIWYVNKLHPNYTISVANSTKVNSTSFLSEQFVCQKLKQLLRKCQQAKNHESVIVGNTELDLKCRYGS